VSRDKCVPNGHFFLEKNDGTAGQKATEPSDYQNTKLDPGDFTLSARAEGAGIQENDGRCEYQKQYATDECMPILCSGL
jgi:hypothetical protein